MKSNCKEVQDKVKDHILSYYDVDDLKNEVSGLLEWYSPNTKYHVLQYMVQGGCFLIYNGDIQDFLNSLGINPQNKEYDSEKSFKLYQHLIALNGEKLLK